VRLADVIQVICYLPAILRPGLLKLLQSGTARWVFIDPQKTSKEERVFLLVYLPLEWDFLEAASFVLFEAVIYLCSD